MSKFYKYLQQKIQKVQLELSVKLEESLREPYSSKLFFFNVAMMNFRLFFWQILIDTYKLIVILFADPGNSFNLIFRQQELKSCPFSYDNFKQVRAKVRIFSVSGATALVVVGVMSSLITNFLFGGKLPGQAETFGWEQTSWNRASTTAVANHNSDQTTWNYFHSKDASVSTSSGVRLGTASSGWLQTSDTDFNANTTTTGVYVNSGSIKLLRPDGATCAINADCLSNWCNSAICTNTWLPGPCAGITVYYIDSALSQWKTTLSACDTPQCGINGAQDGDNLVSNNAVDFTLYPARQACKDLGGRLPNITELTCMYTNRASYRNNFALTTYFSATEMSVDGTRAFNFSTGNATWLYKNHTGYPLRCVK